MSASTTPADEWHVAFALPNLLLPPYEKGTRARSGFNLAVEGMTLGTDYLAIVPESDPRVRTIERRLPSVGLFLRGFKTYLGERIEPAVMIYRDTTELPAKAGEAVIAFRNVVALSTVLLGKALYLKDARPEVSWSDTFDVHPVTPDAEGRLHVDTPAITVFGTKGNRPKFVGVAAPHLSRAGKVLQYDRFLYRALSAEWRRRFREPSRKDRYGRALFRSLQVAMHAAAVPIKNHGSLYDFGVQLGLWVSAIEILTRHANGNAWEGASLDLLSRAQWDEPKLARARYRISLGKKAKDARRVNAIQYACHVLYQARNDFLHGNPVRLGRLRLSRSEEGVMLPAVAAVVYRAALAAYLRPKHAPKTKGAEAIAAAIWEGINEGEYENGMMEVLGLESSRPTRRATQLARRRRH